MVQAVDRMVQRGAVQTWGGQQFFVVNGIQPLGNWAHLRQDAVGPFDQLDLLALAFDTKARLASALGNLALVAHQRGDLLRRIRRAVAKQTVQQKHIEKTHGLGGDTDGLKRVQVHQPYFHVLHAPLAQCMQRPLAGVDRALGADRAVELVLDL